MVVIGIDIGGTKIAAGAVEEDKLLVVEKVATNRGGTKQEVLDQIHLVVNGLLRQEALADKTLEAIGFGCPCNVDPETGTAYEVPNIPSWQEVALRDIFADRYGVPVYVTNDANAFVLGEYHFGQAQGLDNVVGITLGTGLGGGVITHGKLVVGRNGGAGDFGGMPFLAKTVEDYCAGPFFVGEGTTAKIAHTLAEQGVVSGGTLLFDQMGSHLGRALAVIVYGHDPDLVVLGGSISKAYPFFETAMKEAFDQCVRYKRTRDNFRIVVSKMEHAAVRGAAAQHYDAQKEV